ncbi:MAG TPA: preprotein translocase subunit SecG [Candidatus Methylacidiphilales bacterium]
MFWTNVAIDILLFFFVIDCVFMCLVVLMQRSKQEGLGAAFGGGITESMWGAQTSQVLVKTTVWLAAIFFILSILLARLYAHREALTEKGSTIQQELLHPIVPPSTNAVPVPAPAAPAANSMTVPTPPTPSVPTNAPASAAPSKPTPK